MATPSNPNNPIVFMDISVAGQDIGRMSFELFADVTPKTAENFRQFCTGEYRRDGVPLGYKTCQFHRVIKEFMVQGGDFVKGDGTGRMSIYGETFGDENFVKKHTAAGMLSMANSGQNTNGCQFFITCAKCDFLDGKHVVFGTRSQLVRSQAQGCIGCSRFGCAGQLLEGLLVLKKIENVPTGPNNKPRLPIAITQCGEL